MSSRSSSVVPEFSETGKESGRILTPREKMTVAILCFMNLVYFMDRFSLAGILPTIKCFYSIGDAEAGLLQTSFIVVCILFAPIVGYLGDRFSRRWIMVVGVSIWCGAALGSSFVGSQDFVIFIILRSFLGIGEASYTILAPAIISDLVTNEARSVALAIFFFAIPVGSGLGYITGSLPLSLGADWQWGLRITPILGFISVALIAFVLIDPPRGVSEGKSVQASSYKEDLRSLSRNKSFILSTVGAICVIYIAGAVGWWGPTFIALGQTVLLGTSEVPIDDISLIFGVITMICGVVAVPGGALIATKLRPKYPSADALVCGYTLLGAAVFLFGVLICAEYSIEGTYILATFAQLLLNCNWAVTIDIIMFVVAPNRRATATAIQILTTHALGDAGSPFYVGLISEALKEKPTNGSIDIDACAGFPLVPEDFKPLQYGLFTCVFVGVLGGAMYLWNALYMVEDMEKAKSELDGSTNDIVEKVERG